MRGASDQVKRRAIFSNYRVNADLLILQETHSTQECEKIWQNEWGGKGIFSHGTASSRGIAIFTSNEFFAKISKIFTSDDGRLILIDIEENNQHVTLVAVYAPNQNCPGFFYKYKKMLKDRHENKVIIGDFNLVLNVEMDRKNTYNNNNRALEIIEDIPR